jgi:cell division protein FtsB
MFKYISEILSQFSITQRILALLIVLSSIVIITVGPSLIDANTQDCEDLSDKIKRQDTEIITLTQDVDNLKQQIRKNSQECTDEIIKREKEIMEEIEILRNRIRSMGSYHRESNPIKIYDGHDTIVTLPSPVIIEDPRPEMMMDGLKNIQRKIQIDLDKRSK